MGSSNSNPSTGFSPQAGWQASGMANSLAGMTNFNWDNLFQGQEVPLIFGSGGGLGQFGAPGAIMNQAFDPQNALRARETSQLTDQTNSSMAASGIANTPLGSSVMGNTLGNFGIDWQNNQLNREMSGLGSALNAYNSAYSGAATIAQPMESATQSLVGLEGIASQAQTAQNQQNLQQQQQMMSGATGALSGIGGLMGK